MLTALSGGVALAQTPADDFARNKAQEARVQRLDDLSRRTPKSEPAQAEPDTTAAGGTCFTIDRVVVEGARTVPAKAVAAITGPHAGRCVGIGEINGLMRALTELYLDRGLVTARVYVPDQDIAESRVLRFAVEEGKLADIYLDGKPSASRQLATAFPGIKGRPVNIRDIEQGLDQINRLSSRKAKTAMLPGREAGVAILDVDIEQGQPWHFSIGNSNLGQEQTGISQSSVSWRHDNLLDLNDLWSFTYEHSGPDYPGDGDGFGDSDSYAGSLSIPYGYWTVTANGSWYEYTSAVEGESSTMQTSGTSGQLGLTADRVVHRGQSSLTLVSLGLIYKETDNFLLGNRIEVGSRQYTVGSLGLSHSTRLFGGSWSFELGVDQGLDLFGAVEPGSPSAGEADPHFTKLNATVNASTPFDVAGENFIASAIASGQVTGDNLFGAEQMALGSYANVRGSRESLIFGNNGFFVRTELTWRTLPWEGEAGLTGLLGEFRPYLGLDHGRIFRQPRHAIDGGHLTSWTAGARLTGGKLDLDLGYSDVIASSVAGADTGLLFVNATINF
ncbi:ShlB/FhaC/HecB family hemolysin secretion/activation protein [Mesorhizobium plurifarium]|uniref:ShlB/FhaC/HecB family hemolysin secretion/activation protein n=1 Tax=Sinorhizobium arboris TaxID=76745 RepID=UPI00067F0DDB|nr:ShlB/FhaC/HecB family hemolysin secretion/activation protein [Sinorhizobium arboris]PST17387.1 ShlB/FhaC/HecB family hemolysin secretion/activation protein [Mesorhizobium plurifarium]